MSKRKTPKAWTAYKIAKIGKRLGTVYGETEKEALAKRPEGIRHDRRRKEAHLPEVAVMQHREPNLNERKPWSEVEFEEQPHRRQVGGLHREILWRSEDELRDKDHRRGRRRQASGQGCRREFLPDCI